jgi:hypothetical protein
MGINTCHTVLVAAPKVSTVAIPKPTLGSILTQFHSFPPETIFKQLKSKAMVFYSAHTSGLLLVHSDKFDIKVHGKSVIISFY